MDRVVALYSLRLSRKISQQNAVVAVAHRVLTIIYAMLHDGMSYQDLGGDYVQQHDRERVQHHHIKKLEQFGFQVTLAPASVA